MKTIEFDARGKILGRLAGQIANALRGKDMASFRPDRLPEIQVIVEHANEVVVTGKKETQKTYYRFSGYPGGLRRESLAHLRARKPEQLLLLAVSRMLPKNRLRPRFMKRLDLRITPKAS